MKKLIVLVALLFVPLLASAQQSDALLTREGRFYAVGFERAEEHPEVEAVSDAYLVLTMRGGESVTREIVPATLAEKGEHFNPAIAYDADSGMLFLFWIHHSNLVSNRLMFVSRDAQGVWGEAKSFGALYDHRYNLRLAVTRKFEDAHGQTQTGLSVHLAWWEFDFTSARSSARYALATIENGSVAAIEQLDLAKFLPEDLPEAMEPVNESVLRQPLLFPSAKQDSVLLVYGDYRSGTMQSLRIRPKVGVNGGRLRVPGGKRETGFKSPTLDAGVSRLEGIYGDDDRMAFYVNEGGKMRYVVLKDGNWSEAHTIPLDDRLSSGAAVDALRRLVNEQ